MSQVSYGTITITDIPSSGSTNQHFWFNSTQQGTLLAGAYVTNTDIDTFKSGKAGGYLLARSNGLEFGEGSYKSIELIAGTQNDSLNFYEPNSNTIDASLTSSGLVLSKGGIKAGTAGQNGFVYLSSEDYQLKDSTHDGLTINGHTPTAAGTDGKTDDDFAWREVIGTKFGVDSEGNLYAAGAHVDGDIVAQSLTIGSGASAYDGMAAINISGYDIEITVDSTGVVDTENTTYLYPHLYHNGIEITTGIDYSDFIWYQDDTETGTAGDANNQGRYLATYGHNYRVIYDFDDGAVGGGTVIQNRTIDPSKYITKINDTGITIHPEVWANQSSYIQLDSNGMKLFNSNDNIHPLVNYGSSVTFYEPGTDTVSALITTDGMVLEKGGIKAGTVGQNGFVYLSTDNYGSQLTIGNGTDKTDWKAIIGTNFGIDDEGILYATSAHISGEIEATTGLIGGNDGWHIGTNAIYSGNHSTYNTPNVNGIFLGKESNSYYISGGPGAKWWIKDDGTFQLGISGISYDGSTVTFGSNVTISTLTVDTIAGGTVGANGFIYLSKNDYGSDISVGGSASKADWKLIAGSKFGVDSEGNLYANNVNISGDVYSTGGSTGGFTIDSTSIHTTGVAVTSNASNSVALSSSTFTRTINSTSRSNLKFAIGSKFAVANDGTLYANGAYITDIDTSNITLSKIQSDSTHYAQINSSGLTIYNGSTSYPVASFGSTIRMGPSNSGNITINANSIEFNSSSYGSGTMTFSRDSGNDFLTIGGDVYQLSLVNSGGDGIEITNSNIRLCEPVVCDTATDANSPVTLQVSYGYIKNSYAYSNTGSAAANLVISSDAHVIKRTTNTSSLRFKNSISKIQEESLKPYHLYDIEVVQYKYNDTELTDPNDPRRGVFLPGYIAEQVQKVYPIAVDIDEEGRANAVNIHFLLPGMLALIQELNQRINKLEENK